MAGIPGSAKASIVGAIEQLSPDGPSPGEEGIKLAYRVARHQFIPGGNNRIVFVTDGDIYDGRTSAEDLEDFIGQQNTAGITLSCLGVGLGDTTSPELSLLARRGGGHFGSISDEQEAEELLLRELVDREAAIADHVSITADFDTTLVGGYHLIGFENKASAVADTAIKLLGCSAASGHALMAIFEITPRRNLPGIPVIAKLRVNYRLPGRVVEKTMDFDCPNKLLPFEKASLAQKKAACVALFGLKLKSSPYTYRMSWSDLQKMSKLVFSESNYMDREYLSLVARARKIYESPVVSSMHHE